MIFSVVAYAQNTVSGTVVDSDGNPIPGVTVFISGTSQGTTTDFDGNYSISVESDSNFGLFKFRFWLLKVLMLETMPLSMFHW